MAGSRRGLFPLLLLLHCLPYRIGLVLTIGGTKAVMAHLSTVPDTAWVLAGALVVGAAAIVLVMVHRRGLVAATCCPPKRTSQSPPRS